MSTPGPAVSTRLRRCLSAVVIIDLLSFLVFLRSDRAAVEANHFVVDWFSEVVSAPLLSSLVVVGGVIAAARFGLRPGRIAAGAVALVALAVLSTVHAQLFGSPWRHLYFSGVCLLGWLLGLAVARRGRAPADESFAWIGSVALLGAGYFNAGVSKLVYGGAEWMSGAPIQAIVVSQDGLVADSWLSAYRAWTATTPGIASLFSVATLVFELGGPLMMVGRRTRAVVALGLFGMHLNIYLMTHIIYWEAMLFLLLFGLSPDVRPTDALLHRAGPDRGKLTMRFAAFASVLAVCATAAVLHQSRRWAEQEAGLVAPAPLPPPVPPTPVVRRFGPLAVGQQLADQWRLESIDLEADSVVVALAGKPGRARFRLSCVASEQRSPFDLGDLHVYYWNDLDVRDLEPVGRALQAELAKGNAASAPCVSLRAWRDAAASAALR